MAIFREDEEVDTASGIHPSGLETRPNLVNSGIPPPQIQPIAPSHYSPAGSPYMKQEEEGLFTKIAKGFQNMAAAGEGRLPFYLQVEIAKNKADIDKREIQLREANHVQSILAFKREGRKLDAEMTADALKLIPNAKALIHAAKPEDREVLTESIAKRLDIMIPGAGNTVRSFGKNVSRGLAVDFVMQQSEDLQSLYQTMGDKLFDDTRFKSMEDSLGRKFFSSITGRFDFDKQLAMAKKDGLTEEEFRHIFKKTSMEMNRENPEEKGGLPLVGIAFVNEFLSTDAGQQLMAEQGVTLAKGKVKEQGKDYLEQKRNEEFDKVESRIAEVEKRKSELAPIMRDYTPRGDIDKIGDEFKALDEESVQLQHRKDRLLKIESIAKAGGASGSMTKRTSEALSVVTNGKYRTFDDMDTAGVPQEQQATFMKTALDLVGDVSPMGQLRKELVTPADVAGKEIYDVNETLKTGTLTKYNKPLSKAQLQSGNFRELSEKQVKQFQDLEKSMGMSNIVFNMADKLFTAEGPLDLLLQGGSQLAAKGARHAPPLALFTTPQMKAYVNEVEAWSTILARAVGQEVGVLTDTDVRRWTATMPDAGDTPETVRLKRAIMNDMVNYIQRITSRVIMGQLPGHIRGKGTVIDKRNHDDYIEGQLGRLEQLDGKSGKKLGASVAERLRKEITESK